MSGWESLAVTVSAIVATMAFVFSVWNQYQRQRNQQISRWQKAVIHQMFQKTAMTSLSFEEMQEKYRVEASAFPINIKKKELSSEALRVIIMEMVANRIIEQEGEDLYTIYNWQNQSDIRDERIFDEMQGAIGSLIDSAREPMKIRSELFKILIRNPDKYNISELIIKFQTDNTYDIDSDELMVALTQMVARGDLLENPDKKLSVPSQRQITGN